MQSMSGQVSVPNLILNNNNQSTVSTRMAVEITKMGIVEKSMLSLKVNKVKTNLKWVKNNCAKSPYTSVHIQHRGRH